MYIRILFVLISIAVVRCLDNGLGLTPQMGWNSWNHFGCNINENLIKRTADLLVSTGLAQKGYNYLNLDDCWQVLLFLFRLLAMKLLKRLLKIKLNFPLELNLWLNMFTPKDSSLGYTVMRVKKLVKAGQAATDTRSQMQKHMQTGSKILYIQSGLLKI